MIKQCECCGKSFVVSGKSLKKKYCSDRCRHKANYRYEKKPLAEIVCLNCGKTFMQTKIKQKYCCNACQRIHYYNRAKQFKAEPKKPVSDLSEINRKARAVGMSYGQYQMQKYSVKIERKW